MPRMWKNPYEAGGNNDQHPPPPPNEGYRRRSPSEDHNAAAAAAAAVYRPATLDRGYSAGSAGGGDYPPTMQQQHPPLLHGAGDYGHAAVYYHAPPHAHHHHLPHHPHHHHSHPHHPPPPQQHHYEAAVAAARHAPHGVAGSFTDGSARHLYSNNNNNNSSTNDHHHAPAEQESDDDDDEEMPDNEENDPTHVVVQPTVHIPQKEPRVMTGSDKDDPMQEEDDDDDDDDDDEEQAPIPQTNGASLSKPPPVPRGKPEAMAIALGAAKAETTREELLAHESQDDDDETDPDTKQDSHGGAKLAAAAASSSTKPKAGASSKPPAKKKPSAPKKKAAGSGGGGSKAATSSGSAKSKQQQQQHPQKSPSIVQGPRTELLLDEVPKPITKEEYENLDALMTQFCRVPLLAEFSRPVSLLHPELAASYAKIVKHPVDLGHVCRGIRRRQYKNTRDVRLEMWRVFANCVKFHSHPNNKEAVPTFVSIALHLREYFNSLWQEYMLPSELPRNASKVLQQAFAKRRDERKKRIDNSGVLMMSKRFLMKVAGLLDYFIVSGGCVDSLDKEKIFTEENLASIRDLKDVLQNLKLYRDKLEETSVKEEEHTIEEFIERLRNCYSADDLLEEHAAIKSKFQHRLDRLVGKIYAPLHEANCRGVTQSSIWGNIATTIWARESSKKAYWPALCLGILPPEDQREGWHTAVTERNELRLPERLRMQLLGAKKKCEGAQKKQSLSYFLVEFLGTHEFIWVRETDIVEKFDRNQDPNKMNNTKKKRASRNSIAAVTGSKTYSTALEECEWATEEFEAVLQEAFDYDSDQDGCDDDGEFMNFSYALLNQSDEEASEADDHGHVYNDDDMSVSDVDEANWLITHEGQIDASATGRKNAKKRTQAMRKKAEKGKKEAAEASKKDKAGKEKLAKDKASKDKTSKDKNAKKKKVDAKTREREEKKEQREVEKRRKRRTREREKVLRDSKKVKKNSKRPAPEEDPRGLMFNKRLRATAIVAAYMNNMASNDEYKSLALNGVVNVPAAIVDSTGLLGMALGFRAASGELSMPDDSEETDAAKFKPWTKIDCDTPATHQMRTERLEQKVKLLEKEIARIRANIKRRKLLTAEALEQKAVREARIMEDNELARVNPFKKKTKPKSTSTPPASQKKATEGPTTAASGTDDDDQTDAGRSEIMSEDGDVKESPQNSVAQQLAAAAGSDAE